MQLLKFSAHIVCVFLCQLFIAIQLFKIYVVPLNSGAAGLVAAAIPNGEPSR